MTGRPWFLWIVLIGSTPACIYDDGEAARARKRELRAQYPTLGDSITVTIAPARWHDAPEANLAELEIAWRGEIAALEADEQDAAHG